MNSSGVYNYDYNTIASTLKYDSFRTCIMSDQIIILLNSENKYEV